jgi:Ca-activated chloride channel family protein
VQFSLTVDVLSTGLPLQNLRSSLHAVVTDQVDDDTIRIKVQPGERLNRDFILRYQLGAEKIQSSLTLVPDATDPQEGTYLLTVVPPAQQPRPAKPRDVVFVLDRSGSMGGWKMVAARRALGRMVDALTERDRFAIIAFDDTIETPPAIQKSEVESQENQHLELFAATDRQRFRAIEWLAKIDARGGTEMAQPLDLAVQHLTGDCDRVLVLVTDGQVGNEDQIFALLGQRLRGIRIFTLGIDRAVNEAFLKRLAALGGGSCDVVESEDRLDEVMAKVQRRIGTPLWTGSQLNAGNLQLEPGTQVPARLPDLFAGVPLQVLGRYRGTAQGSVVLRATDDAGKVAEQTLPGRPGRSPALAQVWARGRLRDLEDCWVIGGHDAPPELEKQMVTLSLKFGVLCRFTAFVAVDRAEVVNVGGRQHHLVQPVEAVDGWEMRELQSGALGGFAHAKMAAPRGMAMPMSASVNYCFAAPEDAESSQADEMEMEASSEQEELSSLNEQYLAASAPPASVPPSGGFFGRVLRSLLPSHSAASQAAMVQDGPVDLAAYRDRAREILEEMHSDGDRQHGLGVAAVKLAALVDDLRSTGAGQPVLDPLEQLLAELRQVLARSVLAPAQCQLVWHKAEVVLQAFAGLAVTS